MFRKSTTDLISAFLTGYFNSFITLKRLLILFLILLGASASNKSLAQEISWYILYHYDSSPGAACQYFGNSHGNGNYKLDPDDPNTQGTQFACWADMRGIWKYCSPDPDSCWRYISNVTPVWTGPTYAVSGDENKGSCSGVEGNPCDVVTGRKTETFTDFASNTLQFSRSYNSQSIDDGSHLGGYWRHNFELRLNRFSKITNSAGPATYRSVQNKNQSTEYSTEQDACTSGWSEIKATYRRGSLQGFATAWENNQCLIKNSSGEVLAYPMVSRASTDGAALEGFVAPTIQQISMPNGSTYSFRSIGSGKFIETNREPVSLIIDNGAYVFTSSTNEVYRIEEGLVTSKTLANGITLTISRDEYGVITAVTDPFGQSMAFTYDANTQLTSVTHPGGTINYDYDEKFNLSTVTYEDGSIVTYHYENVDFPNHLTGYTNQNGIRFATWTYDEQGRATSSQHANGVEHVKFQYFTDRTVVTDALGAQRTYHLGNIGGRMVVTGISGDKCKNCNSSDAKVRTYDTNGHLASITDWEGNTTTYVRNALGQEVSRTEAAGTTLARVISTEWHPDFQVPIKITEANRITTLSYNSDFQLISKVISSSDGLASRVWTYTYNSNKQLASVDGPRAGTSDTTQFEYDAQGNVSQITNPLGQVSQFQDYTARGLPGTFIDANGIVSSLTYDLRGRLLSRTVHSVQGDASTVFTYDAVGQVTAVSMPYGQQLNYTYDEARRLTKISNALGDSVNYTLDAMGNITQDSITDALGNVAKLHQNVFDQLGLLIRSIGAVGQARHYSYNTNSKVALLVDENNGQTLYAYDALTRLATVTDAANGVTRFNYDPEGNLIAVVDPKNLSTTYDYNYAGELIRQVSPDTGVTLYERDTAGNVTKKTDARGVLTLYSYDALNRLTQVVYPNKPSENISYGYDSVLNGNKGIGRLTEISDQSGTISYVYDHRGNIIRDVRTIESNTYTTSYVYDLSNRLTKITYPTDRIVNYSYDAAGRVSAVTTQENPAASPQSVVSNIAYLPFGPLASLTYGNGINRQLNYDQDYQISSISSNVFNQSYAYDGLGNITSITNNETLSTQNFAYDALSRLTDAVGTYGNIRYRYDEVGNRLEKEVQNNGVTSLSTYVYAPDSNQLLQVNSAVNGALSQRTLSYTTNGNIKQDQSPLHNRELIYNQQNRLESIKEDSQVKALYVHNALGQRVIKTRANPSANQHFHYDLNGLSIAETSSTGEVQIERIYLNGVLVGMIAPSPQAPDEDNDGIADAADNCVSDPNPNQTDTDGDSVGNVCDVEQFSTTSIGTEDGWVLESGEDTSVGGNKSNTSTGSQALRFGDDISDRQYKGILSFDLSNLALTAKARTATFQLTRVNTSIVGSPSSLGAITVDLKQGSFSENAALENQDFQAAATASNAATFTDGIAALGALNAAGLQALIDAHQAASKKLQVRLQYSTGDNDNAKADFTGYYSGSTSTVSRRPKLVIEYTLAD